MNQRKLIKAANSKGTLVKAILQYQQALAHYANESHWAVKGDDIVWLGDDNPTMAAQVTLGIRKVANNATNKPTAKRVAQQTVREPDKKESLSEEPAIASNDTQCGNPH